MADTSGSTGNFIEDELLPWLDHKQILIDVSNSGCFLKSTVRTYITYEIWNNTTLLLIMDDGVKRLEFQIQSNQVKIYKKIYGKKYGRSKIISQNMRIKHWSKFSELKHIIVEHRADLEFPINEDNNENYDDVEPDPE